MEARSFEISQFSVSVNMSTFMAERMLAYSWLSSRPSQVMQLPWWAGGESGRRRASGGPQCLAEQPGSGHRPHLMGTMTLRKARKLPCGLLRNTAPAPGNPGCPFPMRTRDWVALPAGTAPRPCHAPLHPGTPTLRDLTPSRVQPGVKGALAGPAPFCVSVKPCVSVCVYMRVCTCYTCNTHTCTFVVPHPSGATAHTCVHMAQPISWQPAIRSPRD